MSVCEHIFYWLKMYKFILFVVAWNLRINTVIEKYTYFIAEILRYSFTFEKVTSAAANDREFL